MKIFLTLFAILLGFSAIAAGIVAWAPRFAEFISRNVISWRSLFALALLFCCGIPKLPAAWQPNAKLLALAGVLVTIPVCFGVLFFPTETRDAVGVKPALFPKSPTSLLTRLREPWNSMDAERLPAAVDLVRCAAAAYETPEQMTRSIAQLGFPDHEVMKSGPAKGLVVIHGTEAIIAFEGTNGIDDIGDWFANLDTSRGSITEGAVHGGFLGHYNRVADQVRKALEKHTVSHVWITGHSLGGAMAVLCAADLERRGTVQVRGVMTFGQPLLLTPACARVVNQKLSGRHLRFINEDDIVPCVAPGFRGGGSVVQFTNGKPNFCPPRMRALGAEDGDDRQDDPEEGGPVPLTNAEFEEERRKVRSRFSSPEPADPMKAQALLNSTDHKMQKYVDAISSQYGSDLNSP
jgi:triacylglycerol lipase